MGIIQSFPPEKLFLGLLFAHEVQADTVMNQLINSFGVIDHTSETLNFSNFSPYYDEEMGGSVFRRFFSFASLIDPGQLVAIKQFTNNLEQTYSTGKHHRPINLDPGLINTNRLLLATTKWAGHRIPLSEGIYAELTLFYSRKAWHSLPWTYPDFQSEQVQTMLSHMRKLYRTTLNHDR
jgi:hypothetical protein